MGFTLSRPLLHTDEIASLLSVNARPTQELLKFLQEVPRGKSYDLVHDYVFKNSQATLHAVIERQLNEEPQFSPLFTIMAYTWSKIFSFLPILFVLRSFSFIAAVLAFVFLYKILKELNQKQELPSLVTVALFTSPALWILAREARFYSLWALFIVLSWWTLLHIKKHKKYFYLWILVNIIGINLQILHVLVLAPQALFLLYKRANLSRAWVLGGLSLVLLSYAPWAYRAYFSFQSTSNMKHIFSQNSNIVSSLAKTALRTFWDWNISSMSSPSLQNLFSAFGFLCLGLLFYLFIQALRRTNAEMRFWVFIFISPAFFMAVSDLVLKTSFCSLQRYLLPLTLGLLILSVWALIQNSLSKRLTQLALGLWLAGGLFSVAKIGHEKIWRTHPYGLENRFYVERFDLEVFAMRELFAHLKGASPGTSDFIRTLVLLSRVEATRVLLPPEKQPQLEW